MSEYINNIQLKTVSLIVITALICIAVTLIISSALKRILNKSSINNTISGFICSSVKILLYFISILIVIDLLGIPVTALLAAFSVIGLALSLSVQNILSNLASGIIILLTKPFCENDYICTGNESGFVIQTGLFHTKLKTYQNNIIFIPNSDLLNSKITNYSADKPIRVEIKISVSYNSDIKKVTDVLKSISHNNPYVLKEPVPFASVADYANNSIVYDLWVWTKHENYYETYYSIMESIKPEFDKNGIEFTYDHINVHMADKL